MDNQKVHISVVVPVYKCCNSLNKLCSELEMVLLDIEKEYEIILVNDFSPDKSLEIIKDICSKHKKIKSLNLSKNFGQHSSITAGLNYSSGEWVVVMDCDLQDQPNEIKKLYEKAMEMGGGNIDIVYAKRANRQDNYFKKLGSKYFYALFSYLTETKQDSSIANFGLYNRKVIDAVLSMKDKVRAFPIMVKWVGFKSVSIDVKHAKRDTGKSSYTMKSLMLLAFDIILSFSNKPLAIIVKLGFLISLLSMFVSIYIGLKVLFTDYIVEGWASTIISIWFLSGLNIMVLGVVGIYVGKIFNQVKDRPTYIVDETINFKE